MTPAESKGRGAAFFRSPPWKNRSSLRWLIPAAIILVAVLLILGYNSSLNRPAQSATVTIRPADTITPTLTVDPCTPELVRPQVEQVHALMLEFYDASALASQTPSDQLVVVIPSLQEIRRRTDAVKVSACLEKLHTFQVAHMNMVINTMLAFMSKSDPSVLVEGIVQVRLLNEEYKKEKARLLGETYIPPATQEPSPTIGAGSSTPSSP